MDKVTLLEQHGFHYYFNRELYINPKRRKIISSEFVEDHDISIVEAVISQQSEDNSWHF